MKAMRFRWGFWLTAAALLAAIPTAARAANAVAESFNTAPDPAWWTLSGDAAWDASSQSIFLTDAVNDQTGSIFWPWKFQTHWFDASFDFRIGGGSGGEGLTFAWVKEKSFLGEGGSSLGLGGLDGYAIRFDTCDNAEGEPENYIAFSRVTPEGTQDLIVNSDVPEMEDVLNGAGNPAPFHVELWLQANHLNVSLSNPTAATPIPQSTIFDFEIPDYDASDSCFGFTAATSGANNIHALDDVVIHEMEMAPTYRFLSGDLVTLIAAAGEGAVAYTWRQVAGLPAVTLDYTNPPLGVSHFSAPQMEIGIILTFELTVEFPDRQETDMVNIEIEPAGPPGAPEWVRVLPIHLGFTLMWAPVPGAEEYWLTITPGYAIIWPVYDTQYTFRNLEEGTQYFVTIIARNKSGESLASAHVLVTAMRNLALPAASGGNIPPLPPAQGETAILPSVSPFSPAGVRTAVGEAFDAQPDPAWWHLNGSATWDPDSQSILLTDAENNKAGSIFWAYGMTGCAFDASFDFWIGGGSGGEGFTFAWVKGPELLGQGGAGLGFDGLDGYAIRFDTRSNSEGEPDNYIAFSRSTPEGREDLLVNSDIPQWKDVVDEEGNPAPFHVEIWVWGSAIGVTVSNPTAVTPVPETEVLQYEAPEGLDCFEGYFGFTAATADTTNVHAVDNMLVREHDSDPPRPIVVQGGELVTLGRPISKAVSYVRRQVAGEPLVALDNPNPSMGISHFFAPEVAIGRVLTFELTVERADDTYTYTEDVTVLANNRPMVSPANLTAEPLHLGFQLDWDEVIDAVEYVVELETAPGEWSERVVIRYRSYLFTGLTEGQEYRVRVKARNAFGDGDPSEVLTYIPMRNLALPENLGGPHPPCDYVYAVSRYGISRINDGQCGPDLEETSWNNGILKPEDYWGYLWDEPLIFEHVVYWTGGMKNDGGWFTSLTVQYTEDSQTWIDVPTRISPEYDFTDSRYGLGYTSRSYRQYHLTFPVVRGRGIRIRGAPGGASAFTSIVELEVFGHQSVVLSPPWSWDMTVAERMAVQLDGTWPFSTRGRILSYQWEQTGGPPVTLENADKAVAAFEAPGVDEAIVLEFKLAFGDGVEYGTQDVRVVVKNLRTTADAGPDLEVIEGSEVSLDGIASLTTSGSLTYLWTQSGGETVVLKDADKGVCTFTAPTIWDYTQELRFQLEVDDGLGQLDSLSTDEVVVTVKNSVAWPAYPLGSGSPETGYLLDLLHLGNNPTDRILAPLSINDDPLANFGGQAFQRPYPGLEYDFADPLVTVTRNPMRWTPVHSDDGFFGAEPFDSFEQIYHVYILSPTERDARFHFRHDDGVRLWNNGVWVISRDGRDGGTEQQQDFVLRKGLNSITAKFEEGSGSSYFAMGITDPGDQPFADLYYSLGPSVFLTDAYAVRRLRYQWGDTLQVDLVLKINPDKAPQSVVIAEKIPPGIPAANVTAPGAILAGGKIIWNLSGQNVCTQTFSYAISLPLGFVAALVLEFEGTVSFDDTTVEIWGDTVFGLAPAPPQDVSVRTLGAGAFLITWTPSASEAVVGYNVYVRVNAGNWQQVAHVTDTSYTYTDKWFVPGNTYAFAVSSLDQSGREGPLSETAHPAPVILPDMDFREAEDFNYGGGKYPGYKGCPPAIEAPDPTTIGTPQEYDYYHPNTGGPILPREWPQPELYRADAPWIETVEEVDDPGVFATSIGWIDVGSWYRYTFDVREAGWVKFEFRVASPGGGTLAAYWDANSNGEEQLIGTLTFTTGNWHIFTWALMEEQVQTTAGIHTLRVQSVAGGFNFDKIAIQWNAPPPSRWTIWEDNFDSYTLPSPIEIGWGGWTRGKTTNTAGSWALWKTDGPPLGNEPANLAAMESVYMISNSDLSGAGILLDEEIVSPEVDCTGWTKLRLNFNKNYRIYDDPDPAHTQDAEVDIRWFDAATGWSPWTNLLHLDTSDVDPATDPPELSGSEVFDLSAYDGRKLQLKFHFFNAEYDYWFAIDKVRVSGVPPPPEPPPIITRIIVKDDTVELCIGPYPPPDPWTILAVEYCDDLLEGNWLPIPGVDWPLTESRCVVDDIRGIRHRFYRIKGE
ncbi:MAG: fibronectin type III domain-containing protein [bacterium]|nr:fibronectin type III domain-containing protein [bacterium]